MTTLRTLTAAGLMLAAGLTSTAALAAGSEEKKMEPAASVGAVEVHQPWARASAGMARNGGAFMVLKNTGAEDRAVVSAASDVAKTVELHTHIKEGDVMKMREVEKIEVPANGATRLEPGSYHVMLMGLHAPLEEGQVFNITLTLDNGETASVATPVKGVGAMSAGGGHGMGNMKH
ncbi:Copper metal chaperone [Caenispirillum salinarum AK4]|uniref:Copper metal chaperone n=1 Tax=Caenispirillum salinarum AK4 TaxID=1238182 RepID=K9HUK2_9PROT|nr:copper chaperone PCu(A)C [Caenispirillum salinarum]EKV31936.1 Copper metal chaperone [Caenispirillum salinarum AK4]